MTGQSKFVIAALAVMTIGAPAATTEADKHAVIVLDLNGDNPARDVRFADMAVQTLSADIDKLGLGFGDKFSRRSAGDSDPIAHLAWRVDDTFAHGKAEPNDVPRFLRESFAALSEEPEHSESDIVGALSQLAGSVDCSAGSIFVVSNVIDAGRVEGDQFIYPGFPGSPFQGCEITLMGFAMNPGSYDIYTIDAAKKVVTSVLTDAGFASVKIK